MPVWKKALISTWLYRVIRGFLGVIFVWAGALKLADPKAFAEIISAYGLVHESLLIPVAVGLPSLEVLAGLGLVFDVRGSLSTTLGLLALFVAVLWFGILKDLDIDCGCFSPSELAEHSTLKQAMYRDVVMIVAVGYLFWWRRVVPVWSPRRLRLKR
jgi:uncharacterized membrane protein YphA (DoxX/SURF4 family)